MVHTCCIPLLLATLLITVAGCLERNVAQAECAATVSPGGDVSRALLDAPAGATVCLAPGSHGPVRVARARPGVILRGSGADATVIAAAGRDAVDVVDTERLTISDLTLRGGEPAALYATRVPSLSLQRVRVEDAAIGVHVEGGVALELVDVTVAGTRDFGLLVRRGARLDGRQVRIVAHRGIGIAAVDQPGAVALTDTETARAAEGRGEGMVLNGFERFALTRVTVRGGNPAGVYVAKARQFIVRGLRVEGANFGLHVDDNAVADIDDASLVETTAVGLLAQRGGTVTGRQVRVLDAGGTGVSAINGAGPVTLRDSEIMRVTAAGLFAGVAGCADLPPATLHVPDCFYKDLQGQISTIRVVLERVSMAETKGPCLVFFPGVRAEVRESTLRRCELTGLFAWGADADVTGTAFEDNAEHAVEYRAFPDPRGEVVRAAAGTIQDSTVRATRPLEGEILGSAGAAPVLGGGLLAQGSRMVVQRTEVSTNRDIGIAYVNRSTGEVTDSRIVDNGNHGLCIFPGSTVGAREIILAGNRTNDAGACGGQLSGGR